MRAKQLLVLILRQSSMIWGLTMTFRKAERGMTIRWVGVVLTVSMKHKHMAAEVTADKLEEIRVLTEEYLK